MNKIFIDIISDIKRLEKRKKIDIREENAIKNAIEWLKMHQHPDGYWGYESVADTALVLLSFSYYNIINNNK